MWEMYQDSQTEKSQESALIKGQIMSGHSDCYKKKSVLGGEKCAVNVIYLDFSKII